MFLFEGAFGSVLHTGDCRLTPDCLRGLPLRYINADGSGASQASCRVDYLFLDCTFATCSLQFPAKEDSIRQVRVICCCISKQFTPTIEFLCLTVLLPLRFAGDQLHLEATECSRGLSRV